MFFVKRYKPPQTESETIDEKHNVNITDTNAIQTPLEQSPRTRKVLIALFALMLNSYSSLAMRFFSMSWHLIIIGLSKLKLCFIGSVIIHLQESNIIYHELPLLRQ